MSVRNLIRIISALLSIAFVACSGRGSNQEKDTLAKDSSATVNALIKEAPETDSTKHIVSISDTLYRGDTLMIKFKVPHPKDLAVNDPDGKFFFLVFAGDDSQKPSLADWNSFGNMAEIALISNQTKANPWDAKSQENQLIFTKSGRYEILLSDNLETDDGTLPEKAYVYYINRER